MKTCLVERVKIGDTVYVVIDQEGKEVCVLQTFEYADGIKRQLRIWTSRWENASAD